MAQAFTKGGVALITGGGGRGIGFSLAKKCLSHGMRVIVVDKSRHNLDEAEEATGSAIKAIEADVSRAESWSSIKSTIERDFNGRIDFLALNAGIAGLPSWGLGKRPAWEDLEYSEYFTAIFDTNIKGVVNGITALLPLVKANAASGNPSSIVITGSKQGITNPPGNPAYNASKAAVKSLAEHLSFDLRNEANLSVHLLVPGYTFTEMTGSRSRTKPEAAWNPDQVADYLEERMREGQFWVICPDNEVSEDMDKKRMVWSAGDAVQGRPPLSRWREDWNGKAHEEMEKMDVSGQGSCVLM